MVVGYLRAAQGDIRRAARFYAKESPWLAAQFLQEVDRSAALLADYPEIGAPLRRGARKLLTRRFPYLVIYRVDPDRVVILAVGHQRRHPDFWLGRAGRSS
jgi:plasmid stabilization system protein ParE